MDEAPEKLEVAAPEDLFAEEFVKDPTPVDPVPPVVVEEPAEQIPEKEAEAASEIPPLNRRRSRRPPSQDISLTARQFCRARGHRWEQSAGFLHEMKMKHPGKRSRDDWEKLWDVFWNRPVK